MRPQLPSTGGSSSAAAIINSSSGSKAPVRCSTADRIPQVVFPPIAAAVTFSLLFDVEPLHQDRWVPNILHRLFLSTRISKIRISPWIFSLSLTVFR